MGGDCIVTFERKGKMGGLVLGGASVRKASPFGEGGAEGFWSFAVKRFVRREVRDMTPSWPRLSAFTLLA